MNLTCANCGGHEFAPGESGRPSASHQCGGLTSRPMTVHEAAPRPPVRVKVRPLPLSLDSYGRFIREMRAAVGTPGKATR